MILYLAGLKSVDPALREAAAIDGASEWHAFRTVVFPAMRPINIVVLVVTVIEALRAFDIVYVINRGRNGLELLSVLVTDNIIGEASRVGYGSALAVILLVIALVPIITFVARTFRRRVVSSRRGTDGPPPRGRAAPALGRPRFGVHAFLIVAALFWLAPLVWTIYTSLRPYSDTAERGYFSLPGTLTFDNYTNAWTQADMPHYFLNSLLITVPAVVDRAVPRRRASRSS